MESYWNEMSEKTRTNEFAVFPRKAGENVLGMVKRLESNSKRSREEKELLKAAMGLLLRGLVLGLVNYDLEGRVGYKSNDGWEVSLELRGGLQVGGFGEENKTWLVIQEDTELAVGRWRRVEQSLQLVIVEEMTEGRRIAKGMTRAINEEEKSISRVG